MTTFELLNKSVQKAIWDLGWESFRPIQDEAINHLLKTPSDMIISAPTASGKTEAAFLPIISDIVEKKDESVKVLYISPLKALINDQFNRVAELCKKMDFPITKWHGDASNYKKQKLVKDPDGILLITPESLEALFINRGFQLINMFEKLDYIVIDEIHSFIGNERGTQLRSLIRRLESKIEKKIIKIGLSATINNLEDLATWVNPEEPTSVKLIKDENNSKSLKGVIKGFIMPKDLNPEVSMDEELFEVINKEKNLIFANSKAVLELYCDLMQELSKKKTMPNIFHIHHGSLSKNIREHTESLLKKNHNISVFCTNTLELGIDIGSITRIVNLAPPSSVASMIQRLGRSGRSENAAKEFQFFIQERELNDKSNWDSIFRINLIQSIAIVELMLEKWCEPLKSNLFDYSTFTHQILSYLAETGGVQAVNLYKEIGDRAFNKYFVQEDFINILKSLKSNEIIYQNQDNLITLDRKGELLVGNYDFYAAFQTPTEFKIIYNGKEIGKISAMNLLFLKEGSHILLAGKRWEIIEIKSRSEVILVKKAKGKKPPMFDSEGPDIHRQIHQKMLEIYENKITPKYVHKSAIPILEEAFEQYETYFTTQESCILPTFEGSKIQRTIALLLKYQGIECEFVKLGFYASEGKDYLIQTLKNINFDTLSIDELLSDKFNNEKMLKKLDYLLPEIILNKSYSQLALDIKGAKVFCQNLK